MKKVLSFICIILLASCKSTKSISVSTPSTDTVAVVRPSVDSAALDSVRIVNENLQMIKSNKIDFNTFSARIKMDYQGSDKKFNDITAFVRIKKDSAIWVSLNAVLGIEAVRVLITPDSVKVLDKLNKTIQYKDFQFLQDVTQLPINFSALQDLLIGNPVFLHKTITETHRNETMFQVVTSGEVFRNISDFDPKLFIIGKTRLQYVDTINPRMAVLEYGAYEMNGSKKFATRRKVNVQDKKPMNIDLDFKQINFDVPVNFPFSIPGNYKLK